MMTYIQSNFSNQLCHVQCNQYELCKVKLYKDYKSDNLTELTLHDKKGGLFVAILSDKDGNMPHAGGIDTGKQVIYDCMQDKQLHLNEENLYICCGVNVVFHKIEIIGELKKKHTKIKNHNCVGWHI